MTQYITSKTTLKSLIIGLASDYIRHSLANMIPIAAGTHITIFTLVNVVLVRYTMSDYAL